MFSMFTYRCLTVAVLLVCVSHVTGFSCEAGCPGFLDDPDKDKCCLTEYGLPRCCTSIEYHMQVLKDGVNGALNDWQGNLASGDWNGNRPLQDNRDWEISTFDGDSKFPTILIIIALAALFGIVVTCYVLCLCCPCCLLYKRRKRGAVYRRVVTPTVTVPQANQSSAAVVPNHPQEANFTQPTTVGAGLMPSVYNQPPQPLETNFAEPVTMGPPMGYSGYNPVHHPQVAMQPPPPYSVAVAGDPYPKQAPYNPLYQQ
ncbi:uncharacterized protein LOC126262996 isoform X1 [Schistocerca nitens]|uniref:uncharacterized protein LOC126262996 isoform X1 n=1 Tax=Schistocerca nitens TaxID=7011 RepID=UPI002117B528|nr:uncharacterized protein LOC126262996 isoform X1 [Schistocerca nitens]